MLLVALLVSISSEVLDLFSVCFSRVSMTVTTMDITTLMDDTGGGFTLFLPINSAMEELDPDLSDLLEQKGPEHEKVQLHKISLQKQLAIDFDSPFLSNALLIIPITHYVAC